MALAKSSPCAVIKGLRDRGLQHEHNFHSAKTAATACIPILF